jgi:ketosteroid isomerase-like protein
MAMPGCKEGLQMADDQATKDEVIAFIKALNETWTKGDGGALRNYFHPNMVAITALDQDILYGRDACLASWQGFARSAQIRRWEEIEPQVQLYGNTAIVTYYWDLAYEMDGESASFGGRDMFVLVKENGRWQAVADQFSNFPEQNE